MERTLPAADLVYGLLLLAAGLLGGCGGELPPVAAAATARPAAAETAPAPGPAPRVGERPAPWPGVLLAAREVDLGPAAAGRLRALLVSRGQAVAAGARLFDLDRAAAGEALAQAEGRLGAARAELARSHAALATAEDRRERRRRLAELFAGEERVAAENEATAAAATVAAAEAAVVVAAAELERARRELDSSRVEAPFAGRVTLIYRQAGALLAAGEPVLRLAEEGEPLLRFAVPASAVWGLAPGQPVQFRVPDGPALPARIRQVATAIDPPSGLFFVEAWPLSEKLPALGNEVEVFADRVRP